MNLTNPSKPKQFRKADMLLDRLHSKTSRSQGFNLTPIIDIVFLLIIFFMLICQFFIAENFEVNVPDKIDSAQQKTNANQNLTTLTITTDTKNKVIFAVGSAKFTYEDSDILTDQLTAALNQQLSKVRDNVKIVCLRIDKDIEYDHSQIALAAVSQSTATDIQLAVIK